MAGFLIFMVLRLGKSAMATNIANKYEKTRDICPKSRIIRLLIRECAEAACGKWKDMRPPPARERATGCRGIAIIIPGIVPLASLCAGPNPGVPLRDSPGSKTFMLTGVDF